MYAFLPSSFNGDCWLMNAAWCAYPWLHSEYVLPTDVIDDSMWIDVDEYDDEVWKPKIGIECSPQNGVWLVLQLIK